MIDVAGWPPPGARWSDCVPISLWPPADQAAMEKAHKAGDIFDPGGVASRWSAATRKKTISGWGRYLFFLYQRGELDPMQGPADRISPDRLRAFRAELERTTRGYTVENRLKEVGFALRAMAPEANWNWILRAADRVRARTVPAIDKRARLRPVEDLLRLGFRLMDDAEADHRFARLQALQYRDGLMICFLSFHPIRLRNLLELALGRDIKELDGEFLIHIPRTKTDKEYRAMLDPRLTQRFRHYLDRHRPGLLAIGGGHADPGNAVWISCRGEACQRSAVAGIIRKHTGSDGKPALSPHLFRSVAATSIAVKAPDSVYLIPAVLCQSTPKTNERYYNLATSLDASRAHSAVLDELNAELRRQAARPAEDREADEDEPPPRGPVER